ncbi:hypothetical protein CFOL_v3_29947 [Cephalotus follicularis]|uniref:RVT_2 domain-containing protein n=1 Tax=Cephalotus follicularis TaxID=3775 RepID=A0A1Q3D211_CEPFO|nr:hypothetical protein CFOL_v3_29947 [Cephalotus follicularis]
MSQRKYVVDLLDETRMLGSEPLDTPMDPNQKLMIDDGDILEDPEKYRRLMGKLNYLTVTRPDIAFPMSVVSQFLSSPRSSHCDVVIRILKYLKGIPRRRLLYCDHGHCRVEGFFNANWAGSPSDRRPTSGYCVFNGSNLVSWKSMKQMNALHERTKHIEVDCHFIYEKLQQKLISTNFVRTNEQLADVFTKSLDS